MKHRLASLLLSLAFTTPSALAASAKSPAKVDFGKGPNPWQSLELTREELLPALSASAEYLMRNQLADGRFLYINDPLGRCCLKKADKYSMIRHLGAIYALLRAYEVSPFPEYLTAAKKSLDFAQTFIDSYGAHKRVMKSMNGSLSLGENGFLLIDVALYDKLTGHKPGKGPYASLAEDLNGFLTEALAFNGPLATKEGWAESQAVIGIVHYNKLVKKDSASLVAAARWLESATAAGKTSHWHIQAASWLAGEGASLSRRVLSRAVDSALAQARSAVQGDEDEELDGTSRYVGSRKGKLYSCNATARNEGLLAGVELARLLGRDRDARHLWARAKEHVAFALQFQYGLPGNIYEADPVLSRTAQLFGLTGGLADDPRKASVRIDYVAHHIRAMTTYLLSPQAPEGRGLKLSELDDVAELPRPFISTGKPL